MARRSRAAKGAAALSAAGLIFALGFAAGSNDICSTRIGLFDRSPAIGSEIVGRASVIDGDTIEIHGTRIRLNGIDAPESAQTCEDGRGMRYWCGTKASWVLATLLASSSPTRCTLGARDRYRRFVADCVLANGTSVQRAMVAKGCFAPAFR
jgi:endonuclease YncB( thermonuclease family)